MDIRDTRRPWSPRSDEINIVIAATVEVSRLSLRDVPCQQTGLITRRLVQGKDSRDQVGKRVPPAAVKEIEGSDGGTVLILASRPSRTFQLDTPQ